MTTSEPQPHLLANHPAKTIATFAEWKAKFMTETSVEACAGMLHALSKRAMSWNDSCYPKRDVLLFLLQAADGHKETPASGGRLSSDAQDLKGRAFKTLAEGCFLGPKNMYSDAGRDFAKYLGKIADDATVRDALLWFLEDDSRRRGGNNVGADVTNDRLCAITNEFIHRFATVLLHKGNASEEIRALRPRLVPILHAIDMLELFYQHLDGPTVEALEALAMRHSSTHHGSNPQFRKPKIAAEAVLDCESARVALVARAMHNERERREKSK